MIKFYNPEILYLLLTLPLLAILFHYGRGRRRAKIREFGDPELITRLMPEVSNRRPALKFYTMLLAAAFIILALARPQSGARKQKVKRAGVETVIALDISNSMLAEDVRPSRLMKAKKLISRLVEIGRAHV